MTTVFLVLTVMLLLLSALDLFVGVSNDASNFLSSAVGTRITPMAVIISVAALGVLSGASSSSGMMEIARKGMFYPEMFTFSQIMLVFASVMISDVLLLNVFNSLGLPTSTTVSVVFELLGASTCAAFFAVHEGGYDLADVFSYIKLDRTATIVAGILLSVVIAFVTGVCVQFVCRLFFSFRFTRSVKWFGGLFTGISLTAICYFLLVKGAHGASFMKPQWLEWMDANTSLLLWAIFAVWFAAGQVMAFAGLNIFRLIVLSGTFALAFSFAGNDLVNFVGVPLAALDSFNAWSVTGSDPAAYYMNVLNAVSGTDTLWLAAAGAVMCVTLFVSKKARHVVQTTVNLSSSSSGEHEQFGASAVGRVLTRLGLSVSRAVYSATPRLLKVLIAGRYRRAQVRKGEAPMPFDCVRASVNLVVASALISVATSLKLPLSTTYVTFMVAMGSSFADGAWDRESAVYRISGVITVIAGWFLTGMCAFSFAALICSVNFLSGGYSVFVLIPAVFAVIVWTNFIKKPRADSTAMLLRSGSDDGILQAVCKAVPQYYAQELETVRRTLTAFFEDNEFSLRRARNKSSNILESVSENRSAYYSMAAADQMPGRKKEQGGSADARFFFYLVFSNMREAAKSVRYSCDQAVSHIANRHSVFQGEMKSSLFELLKRLERIGQDVGALAQDPSAEHAEALARHNRKLNRDIDRCQMDMVKSIGHERISMHSSEMYLTFLQGMRDFANRFTAVGMQQRALSELVSGDASDALSVMPQTLPQAPEAEAAENGADAEPQAAPVHKSASSKISPAAPELNGAPEPHLTPVTLPPSPAATDEGTGPKSR
ncbi:MAG: inorganic phosphate transporter [Succinivibrio sp.]|nr:inorganic phosphate transporter [Succinivibrio sp.]